MLTAFAGLVVLGLCAFSIRRVMLLAASLRPLRPVPPPSGTELPSVTVLVAARDEEAVVERLLAGLAQLDYPPERLSVVLVSDGSRDGTPRRFERWARGRPRVTVLELEDCVGKAQALNKGLAGVSTTLVAVYDADLRPRRECLRRLATAFRDERVGAAASLLNPENADVSLIARYAAAEAWVHQLVTSVGKDRLGWNPPALGASAFRLEALEQIGLFPRVPFGVDVAATVALTRAGWTTRFVSDAITDNHVVHSLADYWWQHIRWSRGNFGVAGGPPSSVTASLLQRVEIRMLSAGYADRLAFVAAAALAARRVLPLWVPAAYLVLPTAGVILALLKAGVRRRIPAFLISLAAFFPMDALASVAAVVAHFARRPRHWHRPVRSGAGGGAPASLGPARREPPRAGDG